MDHQWRASPGPIQGNICPRCSTPHFPFCSPSPSPIFPSDPMHMQTQPPVYPYTIVDPFLGPRYSETNPNLNGAHFQPSSVTWDPGNANYIRGEQFVQGFDYGPAKATGTGSDYGVSDRSSKRLKMDGIHLPPYVEAYRNPSTPLLSSDDARRLKLIHDHGGGINGLAPIEKEHNPSFLETSAGQASNSSKEYNLKSQVGHLHGQSGYQNALGGSNGASGKRFYSNTSQRPYYDPRTNTPPHTLGHPDHTKYGRDGAFTHLNDNSHYSIPQNGRLFPPTEEISVQPPLPASLPLPIRLDTPRQWITQPRHSSSPTRMSSFVFPFDHSSSTPVHSSYPLVPEAYSLGLPNQHSSQQVHSSGGLFLQDSQRPQTAMFQHSEQGQSVLLKHSVSDKPKMIDALSLFKPPSRDTRPDHFVIILRGLPGSGKSYLARMLRDLEVELGGKAPRIHSMDDYFMTEVEKVEENETLKSSTRGKRPVVKKVLEYCYEPEMEEAYRSSMLKAFKKTLDEGAFTFIIVDDRNLRVADFAQFWATAKISGYEVYLLETSYKDPVGCTARNIHGFTRDDVVTMAEIWEEAPPLYLQLDATLLFHGDDSKESNIHEVDMDLDDEDLYRGSSELKERKLYNETAKTLKEIGYDGSKDKKTWDAEADNPNEEIKDLSSSKWSGDLDVDDVEGSDRVKGKSTALTGLFQAYGKKGKAVRWGDQIPNIGFSIAAMKKANASSLIIGPGSGYDLESNPLRAEESNTSSQKSGDVKQHSVFQERLRAERESFKAVFDRRRQRIGGLDVEED